MGTNGRKVFDVINVKECLLMRETKGSSQRRLEVTMQHAVL
jgi:hypothetical protein